MDCSLPGSFVRGIIQARILDWAIVAISGLGSHFLLQGIFLTQGLSPSLLHLDFLSGTSAKDPSC